MAIERQFRRFDREGPAVWTVSPCPNGWLAGGDTSHEFDWLFNWLQYALDFLIHGLEPIKVIHLQLAYAKVEVPEDRAAQLVLLTSCPWPSSFPCLV